MGLEEVVRKIKENERVLEEQFKVQSIGVLSSVARKERKVNDINIIVEFAEPVGWEIVDLKDFLEQLLGMRVDLLTKKAVMSKPLLWKSIENEILYV